LKDPAVCNEGVDMVQLYGSFYTARVAARAFIKLSIKGSIVFTASMASYRPNKVCAPFTMSTLPPVEFLTPGPLVFFPSHIYPPSFSILIQLISPQRVPSAPYGASKAGIRNMVHTLAMEWAQYSIRVNSVSPGLVKTAMTYWVEQQPDWEQQLKYYGGIPRLAEVEELGGAYVYLLSDAASYTTSIDIPVNGVIGIC
jgi:NAD(P)-dependent dehydrogenase (short-subunit alcohol dehydrogenase family)